MLVIGSKGFAKEVLEVIYQNNPDENICFFDNVTINGPDSLYDKYPILKTFESAEKYLKETDKRVVLGTGNPSLREKLADTFTKLGGEITTIISTTATIGHFGNKIENGCTIMSGAVLTSNIFVNVGCLINLNCTIGHDSIIGKFCELSPGVSISGQVVIGDKCNLGTGAVVLPKITIGSNVIIGAGSVVTKDLPDNCVAYGVPAQIKSK